MADAADRAWRLLIVGAPGSGKGTQAKRLSVELGIPAISTGEMLRQAIASGSELGRRVESIVNSGVLVDDATMEEVVRERLAASDTCGGFLLDGYPRTLAQVEALDRILTETGQTLNAVLYLEVEEDELVKRALGRGRQDDTEAVIRRRVEVYRDETEPVIDTYRERGLLTAVDGGHEIDEVAQKLLLALREAA